MKYIEGVLQRKNVPCAKRLAMPGAPLLGKLAGVKGMGGSDDIFKEGTNG